MNNVVVNSMQNGFDDIIKQEKEKMKNRIKSFLEKNEIKFEEKENEIEIESKLKEIEITPYAKIKLQINEDNKLIIKDMVNEIEIYSKSRIQISKSNLLLMNLKIYFENNKLVFKF